MSKTMFSGLAWLLSLPFVLCSPHAAVFLTAATLPYLSLQPAQQNTTTRAVFLYPTQSLGAFIILVKATASSSQEGAAAPT